jgi:hypothetical protein
MTTDSHITASGFHVRLGIDHGVGDDGHCATESLSGATAQLVRRGPGTRNRRARRMASLGGADAGSLEQPVGHDDGDYRDPEDE